MGLITPLKTLLLLTLLFSSGIGFASSIQNDQGLSVGSSCGDNSDCGTGWCDANRCIYPPSGRLFGEDAESNVCDAVCRRGVVRVTCRPEEVAECACAQDLPSVHCEAANSTQN